VGQAGVQERLRAALRAEHKALVQYAERIREWLDEEHEEAHEEAEAAAVEKPPALSDMRVYSGRLQEQYLCPDPLPPPPPPYRRRRRRRPHSCLPQLWRPWRHRAE
jgi:hypothetical protein